MPEDLARLERVNAVALWKPRRRSYPHPWRFTKSYPLFRTGFPNRDAERAAPILAESLKPLRPELRRADALPMKPLVAEPLPAEPLPAEPLPAEPARSARVRADAMSPTHRGNPETRATPGATFEPTLEATLEATLHALRAERTLPELLTANGAGFDPRRVVDPDGPRAGLPLGDAGHGDECERETHELDATHLVLLDCGGSIAPLVWMTPATREC